MNEKHAARTRHPPPISLLTRKVKRTRSVSNGLEREPSLQPAHVLERQASTVSAFGSTQNIEQKCHVTQLIEQFDRSKSTENVYRSTSSLHSSSIYPTPIYSSSTHVRTSAVQPRKRALEPSISIPQQSSPPSDSKFGTIVHHSSHSISDRPQLYNQTVCHTNRPDSQTPSSESTSTDFMTTCALPSGEYIKSQSDYIIKSARDDSNNSLNKNQTILKERIKEIYTTEETYIKILYVLSFKLLTKMKEIFANDSSLLETFYTIYKPLLITIRRLYKFHYEIIFPYFRDYQTGVRIENIWGIFQEHFQKLEDLYKAYYVTYNEYQRELKRLEKSSALKKIHQAMAVCKVYLGNLCPLTEFNCPNQRLVRYILLMKSYMKYLDENETEYEHTSFIHDEFSRIAVRCEEQLMICPAELNRLKARVDNKAECFDHQQLIWHGSLKKQSARKRNDITPVYLILFSGCLLVYEESGTKLESKRQLSIENITVDLMEAKQITPSTFYPTIGQQPTSNIYYPFRVNAIEKSYELLVDKESERGKWVTKIQQVTDDFRRLQVMIDFSRSTNNHQIGLRAPAWVYDIDATRCQICNVRFGLKQTSFARHHCRACGQCVCGSCSTKTLSLKYRRKEGVTRVCDRCFTLITGINRHSILSVKNTRNPCKTILFGDFRYLSSNAIVWIELQEDYQLHIYAGKLDQVEEFSINLLELREISFLEETRTFVLNGKEERHKFSIELNHQNDYIDEKLKTIHDKPSFYARLWYETIQSARAKTLPEWYIRKRHSTDSGISAV